MAEPDRGGGMNIVVTSRAEIERGVVIRSSYVLISIRDPDKRPVRYKKPSALLASLELAFHDAEPMVGRTLPPEISMMTPEHARQVADFVNQWRARAGAIVVHCEQGMSRSPGVAAAVAEHLGLDSTWIMQTYQPNDYVRQLVATAFSPFREK